MSSNLNCRLIYFPIIVIHWNRRGPPRNFSEDKQETSKNKRDDDGEDNWELPDGVAF